ncbi:MAG: alanine/ornithine racemase family PLP-dependent enzyme [Clostridiales bacterium]|nr:alanine/ornithine racemase family PLP-dependent enzyme [Clostridiales bacterium]
MSTYPMIEANLSLLKHNVEVIKAACDAQDVQLAAVTKVVCADERIAQSLIAAGVSMLADSRAENLRVLPQALPRLSLRIADPLQAEEIVLHSEYSLQSGADAIAAIGQAAERLNKPHKVILMIDLGDLREGIYHKNRDLIRQTAASVAAHKQLSLAGIGTNLTCFGGILPDEGNLGVLTDIARDLREGLGLPIPIISGGNSSSLHLLFEGKLPKGINHLRIGEGLMRGMDTSCSEPFPQLSQRVFTQYARLVEVYDKPSKPEGKTGPNAFGEEVHFEDYGPMVRGILAIGRQDTDAEGLMPLDPQVRILGASSDHLLVDLSRTKGYEVGDVLGFTPSYGALLKAYTSQYITKSVTE